MAWAVNDRPLVAPVNAPAEWPNSSDSSNSAGIAAVYHTLAASKGDIHVAEHEMIECLAETLWEAQSQNQPPNEDKYLERLQRLCNK